MGITVFSAKKTKPTTVLRTRDGVHTLPNDDNLPGKLVDYFSDCLRSGDTCILIATPDHSQGLSKALGDSGFNISETIRQGQYITVDAVKLSSHPEQQEIFERILQLAAGNGRPVKTFAEKWLITISDQE